MRANLVNQATKQISSRFLLIHVVCKITRGFHQPVKSRVQDTINSSLELVSRDEPTFIVPGCRRGPAGPPEVWGKKFEAMAVSDCGRLQERA
jgi:hypothetical protein